MLRQALRVLAVGLAACLALAPHTAPARAQSSAVVGALNRYAAGHHEAALSGFVAVRDVGGFVRMIQEGGPLWVAAATDPADARHRRLVLASVILEVAHARLQEDWADLRGLVEWACALLRTDVPTPEEHVWQLAALAVVEGAYDWRFLTTAPPPRRGETPDPNLFGHAEHAGARFPDDGRFRLAAAMIAEAAAPRETPSVPAGPIPQLDRFGLTGSVVVARQRTRAAVAAEGYERLFDDPAVGPEARLRAGYLRFRLGDPAAALAVFAALVPVTGDADPFVSYLAHFFSGRAHERIGAPADAEGAYRRALDVLPGAQSAAIALSALLFQDGRVDDAYGVMERALAVAPPPDDPWRTYGYGDLRFWPPLVATLRAQVSR